MLWKDTPHLLGTFSINKLPAISTFLHFRQITASVDSYYETNALLKVWTIEPNELRMMKNYNATTDIYILIVSACLILADGTQAAPNVAKTIYTNSTVIGKVFHDKNHNGIQEQSEHGIPGVRLATVTGLVMETDGYGRFHIPDIARSKAFYGRNFILKVDPSSLPQGARVSSENPRVIQITDPTINKINFSIQF